MRLDARDKFPSGMEEYLSHYGWHFSKAMCEWACSKMYKTDSIGKRNYITPWSKEEVDSLLKKYNIIAIGIKIIVLKKLNIIFLDIYS